MATTGATLIDALARRLRDVPNTAHSRDLLRRVLSHSQRVINLAHKVRKATVSFTPSPARTLYRTSEVAANVARLERVRETDRLLPEVPWRQLVDNSRTWYRDIGPRHRAWARIGGNLFVLVPAMVIPNAVDVVYITTPADVVDGATNVDLPDEYVPMIADLAEGIMLLKARLFHALDGCMERLAAMIPQKPGAVPPRTKVND